ncbi:hypothetical protein [Terasakiella pusilla]|uniref:hypothetical protein n=1 Tax=Terasakiella pusilla TaxID=64973 RepID=UPI003AA7AF39
MSELKITKAHFTYAEGQVFADTRAQVCCGIPNVKVIDFDHGWPVGGEEECCGNPEIEGGIEPFCDASDHDGPLIAETFNVANETGMTPRQLLEQRNELLYALKGLADNQMRERLLDAQQDINFHANTTMSQSVADASALIDEIDVKILKAQDAIAKAEGGAS